MKEKITAGTCVTCGLCCISVSYQDAYCDVSKEDMKRLGKKFVRLNVLNFSTFDQILHIAGGRRLPDAAIKTRYHTEEDGPLKGISIARCAALEGTMLKSVSCSVYKNRPDTCRTAVVPGDKTCRWFRSSVKRALKEQRT